MKKPSTPLNCFVATLVRDRCDAYLNSHQLDSDLAIFAIPDYGILLKCPMEGDILDIEFAAFFGLLRHITTDLSSQKIKDIQVLSSNPQFVLSFTGQLPHLIEEKERRKLLMSYSRKLTISVGLIETFRNQAFLPLVSFPSVPPSRDSISKQLKSSKTTPEFKKFQRGVRLNIS